MVELNLKKKVNVLSPLLKCALFGEEVDEQIKSIASERVADLYDMTARHDIVNLIDYAFRKSGISVNDETLEYEYIKQQAMSVMRYENQNVALCNISELFEKEKIPFISLKGAVIRKFYPEPWMRTSCDIDILVHKQDLERAKKSVVEKLGFKYDKKYNYHDVSLYSDEDVHLELHFSIKENMEKIDKLLDRVWDYATPKDNETFEYVLTNEFFMFQTIAHMAYHFKSGGCGIRSYIDLMLLKKKLVFDEKVLSDMLKECQLQTFYESCLRLIDVWFFNGEHDEITRHMHKYLVEGGTYGSKNASIAVKRIEKGRLEYALERVFMPYDKLIITYPALKGRPWLTPLYQLKRWCRGVTNGKFGKKVRELSESTSVPQDKIDNLNVLLKRVGLK